LGNNSKNLKVDTELTRFLFKGTLGSFLIKIITGFLTLTTSVVLARTLGPKEYGLYSYAITVAAFLTIFATFGLPDFLTRQVSIYQTNGDFLYVKRLFRWSFIVVLIGTTILFSVPFIISFLNVPLPDSLSFELFVFALVAVPLMSLLAVLSSVLRGLKLVLLAQMANGIIRPLVLLILVIVLFLIFEGGANAKTAIVCQLISLLIAFVVCFFFVINATKEKNTNNCNLGDKRWLLDLLPFFLIGLLQIINSRVDILVLGFFRESTSVGNYQVSLRLAELVSFILISVNGVFAPVVAELKTKNDLVMLQKMVTKSVRWVTCLALPLCLALFVFSTEILEFLFGSEYVAGDNALRIFVVGQFVNCLMGSVALLLNMSGHQSDTLRVTGLSAIINISLSLLLVPMYGINGAAIASVVSLVVWNVLLSFLATMRLGIHTTPLGKV